MKHARLSPLFALWLALAAAGVAVADDKPADKATTDKPAAVAPAQTPAQQDAAAQPAVQQAAATTAAPPVAAPAEKQMEDMNTVVLRTIDKLSARTHTFDIPVDKTVKFGNSLFIKARACRKSSPLDLPEAAAFLQVWERKPAEPKSHWLFSGWMFASSPSLSRLDHPVYDVWVIECRNANTSKSEEFSSETVPTGSPDAQPLSGNTDDISFVAGAKPDKSAERVAPEDKPAAPATDAPVAKPASDAAAVPAPAPKPAPKPADKGKAAVPPLEQLPGSFDEGDGKGDDKTDDLPSGGD